MKLRKFLTKKLNSWTIKLNKHDGMLGSNTLMNWGLNRTIGLYFNMSHTTRIRTKSERCLRVKGEVGANSVVASPN